MTSQKPSSQSHKQKLFLLGFRPFLYKELQEWKQKRAAIAILMAIPLLISIFLVSISKLTASQAGKPLPPVDLALAASSYALNGLWIFSITVLLSIGLIPKELDSGTLAWNLTKPLSRTSFLLGKWLSTTLMTWLIGVVLADLISLIVTAIGLGGTMSNFNEVVTAHLAGFCMIGFWVLFCLLLGMLLKDQASVGAGALMAAISGTLIGTLPNEQLRSIAPFYFSNTVDWAVSLPMGPKLIAYLAYMMGMAIAAKLIFERKEFS